MTCLAQTTVAFCHLSVGIDGLLLAEYRRKQKVVVDAQSVLIKGKIFNPTDLEIAAFDKLRKASEASKSQQSAILNEFFHLVTAYNAVLSATYPDLHQALIESSEPCKTIDEFVKGCLSLLDTDRIESLSMIYSW
jgi:hypothetical protein